MKIKIIISLIFFLAFANQALAGKFFFQSPNSELKPEILWKASLWFDSENEQINTIGGSLVFPTDKLDLQDINIGNSLINFWIEEPSLSAPGQVRFSGIIPGGFLGKAQVFEFIFKTKNNESQGRLDLQEVEVFLNDGLANRVNLAIEPLVFEISNSANFAEVTVDLTDNYPPETFTPIITKIPEIAGDNYVLIFSTQDKGSGIDYYEVKEGYRLSKEAESPYVLQNQKLDKEIVVKAIDRAGNERRVVVAALYPAAWYENYWIFVIIITLGVLGFVLKYKWKKIKQK